MKRRTRGTPTCQRLKTWQVYASFLILLLMIPLALAQDTKTTSSEGSIRVLLVPYLETTLSSQILAEIKELQLKEGDAFKQGTILVEFDCSLYHAQLNKAKVILDSAEKTYQANIKLQEFKAISELEVVISKAEVEKAKAEIAFINTQIGLCRITAPFSGRVIKLHTAAFASVSPGTPLMDILDDNQLEMQLHVPSTWLRWIKPGVSFEVQIDETQRTYNAKVLRLGAKVDATSRTIEIIARIADKDKLLLPGMSGVALFNVPN